MFEAFTEALAEFEKDRDDADKVRAVSETEWALLQAFINADDVDVLYEKTLAHLRTFSDSNPKKDDIAEVLDLLDDEIRASLDITSRQRVSEATRRPIGWRKDIAKVVTFLSQVRRAHSETKFA